MRLGNLLHWAGLTGISGLRPEHAALLAGASAVFLGASLRGQEFPHYWVPMVPFAALLAGVAVVSVTENWTSLRHRLHVEVLFCILALTTFIAVLPLYTTSLEQAHLKKYGNSVSAKRDLGDQVAAAYIASITEPDDRIFNLGVDAQWYVLSDRRPASYFTRPLAAALVNTSTFDETLEALYVDPPALIVVDTSYVALEELGNTSVSGGSYAMEEGQRLCFEQFLAGSYLLHDKVEHAVIYVLKP